ncbi:MAG: hypothetical protein GXP25_23245 [Planctomycetes bacterium]|nr:hypothetical protein [Planctomycetota bacterium]
MENYIKRKSPNMAGMTLKSYTLWKLTGDDKYRDLTRRGLQVAIEHQKRKPDIQRLLLLVEPRYWIWQHDPKTPAAPPNIEQDFAMIWAKIATEHDESWMFQEWGYHNRCWHRLGVMKIAKYFAEKLKMPVSPRIEEYIAWHQPRYDRFGACTDNSSGYHWVGFRYPVYWCMVMDTLPELARHKGWVEALGRWRQYSSPSGAVPNFGDTSGWSAGAWEAMANFELMGALTKDGRFRWQAHRIAEWLYNHFWPRHDQYHLPRDRVGLNFCRAWLRADDSIKPVAPSTKSRITFRTKCVEPTEEDKAARPGWSGLKLVDEKIPAKLILTSGNNPQALWALVELVAVGGHCGHLPGHICGLLQHDAALLAGQGYYERSGNFNNILWIEDREGLAVDPRPIQTEVPIFVEDRDVTRVRIRATPFQQMPVTVDRDIVFVKNGFVLVKDRATFHATMNIRVGPCWQTRDLGPQCGDDWFNAYYEYIYYTGLGLGKGVHAYRNPAWDLLVRFAPRADTRITVQDRYEDNPFRTSPTMLRQSWAGIAKVGDVKTFTTILLPHGPAFDVTPYADWAQFVVDNDKTTLVHVRTEMDNMHHFQETHWVLLQEKPGMVEAKGFRSDAAFALVSTDRKGKLKGAVMVGGTILEVDGKDLAAGARKPKAESIFEIEK